MISEKPRMAFSGVRSSWLILARNAVLEALAVSASKRLRKRFVAGFFQFAREIFHFEAQARVLVQAIGEPAAIGEKLRRRTSARTCDAEIEQGSAEQEAQRRDRGERHQAAMSMSMCVARLTTSAPEHAADDAGDENVIDRIARRPTTAMASIPRRADRDLDATKRGNHACSCSE